MIYQLYVLNLMLINLPTKAGKDKKDSSIIPLKITWEIKMFAYQLNLPFDITKPPPPIEDSFPHPKLLEQLRQSDEALVQQFLSTRKDTSSDSCKKPTDKVPVNITTYRSELREALLVLEGLKHSKMILENLRNTQHDSDSRWSDELDRTEELQCVLHSKLEALENVKIAASLTRKLAVRKKKRAWQKRRIQSLRIEYENRLEDRKRRMEDIFRWEIEWKDRLEKEQAVRDELQAKTLVLADVRRRKARAKRYVNRFEKTIQLYEQRHSAAKDSTQGGSSMEATGERFRRDVDALNSEWKSKLCECIKEEKRLKDELARRSAGNESRRRDNRWRKALFGDAAALARGRAKVVECDDMIKIRWAWDAYTCSIDDAEDAAPHNGSEKGYPVPTGWIFPPEYPSNEWAIFREAIKNKSGRTAATKGSQVTT